MTTMTVKRILVAVGTLLIIWSLFSAYSDIRSARKAANEKTATEIKAAESIVREADVTMERIYSEAEKEVKKKNAEIISQVKILSPDAVADRLNALLAESRRERGQRGGH